jgi:hypothetical protein
VTGVKSNAAPSDHSLRQVLALMITCYDIHGRKGGVLFFPFFYNNTLINIHTVRYSSETPTFYQNDLEMRNTVDVSFLQSISGVNAVYPLVAFYDIRARKRERVAILLFCPGHHTSF